MMNLVKQTGRVRAPGERRQRSLLAALQGLGPLLPLISTDRSDRLTLPSRSPTVQGPPASELEVSR